MPFIVIRLSCCVSIGELTWKKLFFGDVTEGFFYAQHPHLLESNCHDYFTVVQHAFKLNIKYYSVCINVGGNEALKYVARLNLLYSCRKTGYCHQKSTENNCFSGFRTDNKTLNGCRHHFPHRHRLIVDVLFCNVTFIYLMKF